MENKLKYISENGDTILFNADTYYKIVLGCIKQFTHQTEDEVTALLKTSYFFSENNYPQKSYNQLALLDNETIYDIAMNIVYGDEYWNHPNFIPLPFDKYHEWENNYIAENNLDEKYIEYM